MGLLRAHVLKEVELMFHLQGFDHQFPNACRLKLASHKNFTEKHYGAIIPESIGLSHAQLHTCS